MICRVVRFTFVNGSKFFFSKMPNQSKFADDAILYDICKSQPIVYGPLLNRFKEEPNDDPVISIRDEEAFFELVSQHTTKKDKPKTNRKFILNKTSIGNGQEIRCNVCLRVYLNRHMYNFHHKSKRDDTKCCACEIQFESLAELEEHRNKYPLEKRCCRCLKEFKDQNTFDNHRKRKCKIGKTKQRSRKIKRRTEESRTFKFN